MYGRSCVGVDGPGQNEIISRMVRCSNLDVDQLSDMIRDSHADSMGLGVIVYWPSVEWTMGPWDHVEDEKIREFLTSEDSVSLDVCAEIYQTCSDALSADEQCDVLTDDVLTARQESLDEMRRQIWERNSLEFRSACRDFWSV